MRFESFDWWNLYELKVEIPSLLHLETSSEHKMWVSTFKVRNLKY
jgi:hypothetical protein